MKRTLRKLSMFSLIALPLAVASCGGDESPADKAGDAVEDAADDAEEAAEEVEDAVNG